MHTTLTTTTPDEYLDEDGAAQFLKLSPRTLQRYRQEGGGPTYIRLGMRRVGYAREDLITWANARKFANTSEEGRASAA